MTVREVSGARFHPGIEGVRTIPAALGRSTVPENDRISIEGTHPFPGDDRRGSAAAELIAVPTARRVLDVVPTTRVDRASPATIASPPPKPRRPDGCRPRTVPLETLPGIAKVPLFVATGILDAGTLGLARLVPAVRKAREAARAEGERWCIRAPMMLVTGILSIGTLGMINAVPWIHDVTREAWNPSGFNL